MKHKQAEVLKAWADGIKCQYWCPHHKEWSNIHKLSIFDDYDTVRIKPEPKPNSDTDIVNYMEVGRCSVNSRFVPDDRYLPARWTFKQYANLILTWDGETGELKSAEVIK